MTTQTPRRRRTANHKNKPSLVAVKLLPYDPDRYIRIQDIERIERQSPNSLALGYVKNPIGYRDLGQQEDRTRAMLERERWYCARVRQGRERHNYLMSGASYDELVETGAIVGA